jgi:hypothetical protein
MTHKIILIALARRSFLLFSRIIFNAEVNRGAQRNAEGVYGKMGRNRRRD